MNKPQKKTSMKQLDYDFDAVQKLVPWPEGEPSSTHAPGALSFVADTRNKPDTRTRPAAPRAIITRLGDIESRPISWLWPGRIALGKLTLIAGDPGLGKSLITASLAAIISRGDTWPVDGSPAPIGDTILLSAEDDAADTIRPRVDAAGADCNRIHILQAVQYSNEKGEKAQRMFSLADDVAILKNALADLPGCRLVVIDPISAYLGETNSHNNAEVRGVLAPLSDLAAQHNVAIVLVHHLNKNSGGAALYRAMGSLAFTAAVRAAHIVGRDKNNPERVLIIPTKNNIGKNKDGLAYSIKSNENDQPVIEWEPELVKMTADEALAVQATNEERTDTNWAVDLLESILADGPMPAAKVKEEAKQAGVTDKALRRAADKLGIKPKKIGYRSGWVWVLPAHQGAQDVEDAHTKKEGTFDAPGHLGKDFNNSEHTYE